MAAFAVFEKETTGLPVLCFVGEVGGPVQAVLAAEVERRVPQRDFTQVIDPAAPGAASIVYEAVEAADDVLAYESKRRGDVASLTDQVAALVADRPRILFGLA